MPIASRDVSPYNLPLTNTLVDNEIESKEPNGFPASWGDLRIVGRLGLEFRFQSFPVSDFQMLFTTGSESSRARNPLE